MKKKKKPKPQWAEERDDGTEELRPALTVEIDGAHAGRPEAGLDEEQAGKRTPKKSKKSDLGEFATRGIKVSKAGLVKANPKAIAELFNAADARTAPAWRRKLAVCKEFKDRYRRDPAPVLLWAAFVLPTLDAVLDWLVTYHLFTTDNASWLPSFAVNLVSGYFMGMVYIFTVRDEGGCMNVFTGVAYGMLGLVPAATVLSGFCADTGNVRESRAAMKSFVGVQLLLEALPQSVLQAYLGITEGMMDTTSANFQPLLVVSVAVASLGAGVSVYSIETRLRPGVQFMARYAVVAVMGYAATFLALVFWMALTTCAFDTALFWLVLMIVFCCCFSCVVMRCNGADMLLAKLEQKYRRNPKKRSHKKKKKKSCFQKKKKAPPPKPQKPPKEKRYDSEGETMREESDSSSESEPEPDPSSSEEEEDLSEEEEKEYEGDVEVKPRGKRCAVCGVVSGFLCFLIMAGTMSLLLGGVTHARNNYGNATSLPGAPGGKSDENPMGDAYRSCLELPVGLEMASSVTIAAVLLTVLTWATDSLWGPDLCRAKPWEERVMHRTRGMSTKQSNSAKALAVFRWADLFYDGVLEPQEIYRLAAVTKVEYERICWELSIGALTERQLDEHFRAVSTQKKMSDREMVALRQAVVKASIDEHQFVTKPPKSIDDLFTRLQLDIIR